MNKFYFAHYRNIIITAGVCLCSLLFINNATAQVVVTDNQTAAALAQKLVGTGVTVLNPTITCNIRANGIFTVTASNLGFDSGVIMSSGYVKTQNGIIGSNYAAQCPQNPNASYGFNGPSDVDLNSLAGSTSGHDACTLAFDFRPQGDTIKFDYIFGSEEYTDYTCSGFNDVFGFFISGPGITGPYTNNAKNIAIVPGTTNIPVCINSVNCGGTGIYNTSGCTSLFPAGSGVPFCTYYVNNCSSTTIAYDGLTTILTAIAGVTPCDTYHLKLGVEDMGDDAFDSGVFLKAGSLSSTGISINPNGAGGTNAVTGNAIRGCNPGNFVFNVAASSPNPLTIHYIITGTAVNGYDYVTIPDSIVIPANALSATQVITPLGVPPAGPKSVTLEILSPYTCNGVQIIADSSTLWILDSLKLTVNPQDTAICQGQSVQIQTNGDSLLSYSWSPAAGLSSSTVENPLATPQATTTYSVTASTSSIIGCVPVGGALTILVYQPPVVTTMPDNVTTCLGTPVQLNITATPNTQPYTYSWNSTTGLNDGTIPNPIANPTSDITYTVTVSPPVANCSGSDTVHVRVLPNDFTLFTPDTTICRGDSVEIRADGVPDFTYTWTPPQYVSDPNIINPSIYPTTTGSFIYTITATYPNCPDMPHSIDITVQQSIVHLITRDTSMCLLDPMQLLVADSSTTVTYTWSPGEFLSDPTIKEPYFYTQTAGSYTYTLTEATPIGCLSSDSVTITVRPAVQMAGSPLDTTIYYGGSAQLNAWNLRPEPLSYFWRPDNGTLNNPNISYPIATPQDPTTYIVVGQNEWGCRDSVSLQVNIDFGMTEFIPSAFSPNGDGRNDVFRVLNMKYQKLLDFRVYDRWGKLVYQTTDVNKGWDGTYGGIPQEIGAYNYIIIIARPDGTEKTYTGTVTLVR